MYRNTESHQCSLILCYLQSN